MSKQAFPLCCLNATLGTYNRHTAETMPGYLTNTNFSVGTRPLALNCASCVQYMFADIFCLYRNEVLSNLSELGHKLIDHGISSSK